MPNDFFQSILNNGEAFFASSNSNLIHIGKELVFVTGGLSSRLWTNGMAEALPLLQGTSSTGANSIAISPDGNSIIVVGGDFANDTIASQIIVRYQLLKPKKSDSKEVSSKKIVWKNIDVSNPNGYKSCVEFIDNDLLITCGTSGIDVSKDKGAIWNTISKDPFHIVKKHPTKRGAYLAGSGGRISFVEL
jgi:sugar lactone lactonase YvrE